MPTSDTVQPPWRLVVVAESEGDVRLWRLLLQETGMAGVVTAYETEIHALAALGCLSRHAAPDLIVMRWPLPMLTAGETVEALRAIPALRETVLLIVGDGAVPHHVERLAGVDGVVCRGLAEPMTADRLRRELHLARRKALASGQDASAAPLSPGL